MKQSLPDCHCCGKPDQCCTPTRRQVLPRGNIAWLDLRKGRAFIVSRPGRSVIGVLLTVWLTAASGGDVVRWLSDDRTDRGVGCKSGHATAQNMTSMPSIDNRHNLDPR